VRSDKFAVTEIIDHKFPVTRHTLLPNEKNERFQQEVYVPDDWLRVIGTAKKEASQFVVTKLNSSDFVSLL